MRAILIDPRERKVTEVDFSWNYRQIYEYIDSDVFDAVRLAGMASSKDVAYVDDEGLFRPNQVYFTLEGYPQPLAGKALVLGVDYAGETVAASTPLSDMVRLVGWVRPDVEYAGTSRTEGELPGGRGRFVRNAPVFRIRATGELYSPWDE